MSQIPGPPGLSDAVQPIPALTAFPAVNSITLANFPMPGRWTLTEAKKKFGWQIQKGYGLSGAVVFPTGDELVVAKFEVEFWSNSDFNIFKNIRKQLLQKPVFSLGGALLTAALGIDHPELKALGVTSVVVLEVGAAIDRGGGDWVCHIDFLQYRAPLPAPPKPTTTIPDVASPAPVAQDAQEVEIQKLQAQAAALLAKP
jgi:hypothetical protein